MSTRIGMVIVSCICLILSAGTDVRAGKAAGKTGPAPASALFRDLSANDWQDSDQVFSDKKGEYVNGSNVTCYVDQSSTGTGQFLLKLEPVGKTSQRRSFWFDFSHALSTDCDRDAVGPRGVVNDYYSFLHIGHLGDIPVPGQSGPARVARYAHFYTSAGYFRYAGQYYDPHYCSTNVVVSRLSKTQWLVTTDAAPGETLPAYNSTEDPTTWNSVGKTVQLENSSGFAGNCAMSFQIIITCPTCK